MFSLLRAIRLRSRARRRLTISRRSTRQSRPSVARRKKSGGLTRRQGRRRPCSRWVPLMVVSHFLRRSRDADVLLGMYFTEPQCGDVFDPPADNDGDDDDRGVSCLLSQLGHAVYSSLSRTSTAIPTAAGATSVVTAAWWRSGLPCRHDAGTHRSIWSQREGVDSPQRWKR